ncbi:MAG: DUF1801 domain-containing protein [Flavobacteriaceae bacterium]|nr:DUF1801 domain-containing protein [Flavobacteriaceae bacterium]
MEIKEYTLKHFIDQLPDDRKRAIEQLRKTILDNLPKGFVETISYGTIDFVVPHSIYPNGYHCNPKQPLPFISIASQKNYIALYHTGMYGDTELTNWFKEEYPKHCKPKLDMGKGCIRFKKIEQIPYGLIAELSGKMNTNEWIKIYETNIKR